MRFQVILKEIIANFISKLSGYDFIGTGKYSE